MKPETSALLGQQVGHIRIVDLLGEGGMGAVYVGFDDKLQRKVALKTIRADHRLHEQAKARFLREARILSQLEHPNLCTVHDFIEGNDCDFLVLELVEGLTLREMLTTGPMPSETVFELGTQLSQGLAKAHSAGIIHRDLKPENVMVTADRCVKILDFGLAKLRTPASESGSEEPTMTGGETAHGTVMGTVGYMSPEQAKGEPADYRSDIFSLGTMLYEMVTGRRAFQRDTPVQTLAAIIEDDPVPLTETQPGTPSQLRIVIERCMAKEPERRYGSADVLVRDLKAIEGRPTPAALDSIAVLPLENLSNDPEQEYFADGMTDELIAELAQISALKVISRTSVMRYKGTREPLPAISRQLNVHAIVEGTVRRDHGRVRITAQLIEAESDRHLWAGRYERELSDVFALQSDVARAIAQEVRIKLTGDEEVLLRRSRSVDPETHELYLKGLYYWNRRTVKDLWKGLGFFREALERDPENPLAYVGLARSFIVLAGYEAIPSREALQKAKLAALKAIELDATLGDAHHYLAVVSWELDWDFESADAGFRHAIELNPNHPPHEYAEVLITLGRFEEGLEIAKRARELDPLSLIGIVTEGDAYYLARQYDRAERRYRDVINTNPEFIPALRSLGVVLETQGRYEDAIAEHRRAVELSSGNPLYLSHLGRAYAVSGRHDMAREMLDKLSGMAEVRHVSALSFAMVHMGLGDTSTALDWLEKAAEERYYRVLRIGHDQVFDVLRSEDRFGALLQEMGFAE